MCVQEKENKVSVHLVDCCWGVRIMEKCVDMLSTT